MGLYNVNPMGFPMEFQWGFCGVSLIWCGGAVVCWSTTTPLMYITQTVGVCGFFTTVGFLPHPMWLLYHTVVFIPILSSIQPTSF
jgi:hypothetical protein